MCKNAALEATRGGQSSVLIYLSKNIVIYFKNTQVKIKGIDEYYYLSKSIKVFETKTTYVVKVESNIIF